MNRAVSLFALALLFIATAAPATAQSEAGAGAGAEGGAEGEAALRPVELPPLVYYDVGRNLSLACDLPANKSAPYVWSKNGTAVDELADLKGRYKLDEGGATFHIEGRSHENDFGNYTCAAGGGSGGGAGGGVRREWEVRGRPHARLEPNTNVVEGQKLRLQCRLTGRPFPGVVWRYTNGSESDAELAANGTEVRAALGSEVQLQRSEQGVAEGELVVSAARLAHAGRYACVPPAPGLPAVTTLRVKDMYAALWPFLGICAEVFVLCAIILVYEKRRTKPELDDSDTDNHDQKKS